MIHFSIKVPLLRIIADKIQYPKHFCIILKKVNVNVFHLEIFFTIIMRFLFPNFL